MSTDPPHDSDVDWEAVYWEQMPRLYNFFRYRTGDGQTAQDLTAQTMMRAWRYRHSYNSDVGAFSAWLFQIARRVALDHLRKIQDAPLPLYAARNIAAELSVEAACQKSLDAQRLYALLQALPAREQELIALKYGAEMTNRDISTLLNMSESNVGTLLHRTITKLRQQWETEACLISS